MVIIKLKIDVETRRLNPAPLWLKDVKEKAKKFFSIENPCFFYTDPDGEKVMFDTQEEYSDVLGMGIDPLLLWVEDADLAKLKRSTTISNLPPIEPRPALSMSIPLTFSIFSSDSRHTSVYEKKEKADKEVGNEKKSVDVQHGNSCLDVQEKEISWKNEVNLESLLEKVRLSLNVKENKIRKLFMGVKCCCCRKDVYDLVFKCNECHGYFLCVDCEEEEEHCHVLAKSRFKVQRRLGDAHGHKSTLQPEHRTGVFDELRSKSEYCLTRK